MTRTTSERTFLKFLSYIGVEHDDPSFHLGVERCLLQVGDRGLLAQLGTLARLHPGEVQALEFLRHFGGQPGGSVFR